MKPRIHIPGKAKKELGQHFLTSKPALKTIVESADITPESTILEIGPGTGVLTEALLAEGAHVIAIEKDTDLIPYLEEKFESEIETNKLTLITGDIRAVLPETLPLTSGKFSVVANIPYYLTGLIFREILGGKVQPASVVFLVQKEVAERIAREKKESIASLAVKAYGNPHYVSTVKAGSFSPPPKVDSAILKIDHISRNNFVSQTHEECFFELIKHAFASKRKQLLGNLSYLGKEKASELLSVAEILPTIRAEDVPLEKWLLLSKNIATKTK